MKNKVIIDTFWASTRFSIMKTVVEVKIYAIRDILWVCMEGWHWVTRILYFFTDYQKGVHCSACRIVLSICFGLWKCMCFYENENTAIVEQIATVLELQKTYCSHCSVECQINHNLMFWHIYLCFMFWHTLPKRPSNSNRRLMWPNHSIGLIRTFLAWTTDGK